MSTIACSRCGSVFPLAQVAQFDQFTCGACGTIVPVPSATPVALPPMRPAAPPPVAVARPAARPAPAQPSQSARPAQPTQPSRPAQPAAPAARAAQPPAARPGPAAARPAAPPPSRPASRTLSQPVSQPASQPVPTLDPEPDDDAETPSRGRRGRGRGDPAKPNPMPLVLAGAGVLVLGVVGFLMLRSKDAGTDTAGDGAGAGGAALQPVAPPKVAADPDKDPSAWKALPEIDRKMRTAQRVANVNPQMESAARETYEFLAACGETDAALGIARDVARVRPEVEWAHVALGHEDLKVLFEKCQKECQGADFNSTESMQELQRFKRASAPRQGPWWGDEATQAKVKDLIARVYEEEKTLATPFGQGVAKWVVYHKSIEVMRDYPALHGTVGPYLVFVSLPVEGKTGDVTLADVKPEDVARGKAILDRTLKLYGAFYDAWHATMGPMLGLTKYGPENTTQETTLLVNVFTRQADYRKYNEKIGGPGGGARAYYSPVEPRFITTYDGPAEDKTSEELGEDTAQVQCHEGVHQLAHFATWELVKKQRGTKPDWRSVGRRPMWSEEGFAEFFAAYRKDGDRFVFMQPLDDRMCDLWTIGDLLKSKKWEDWRLREILEPYHNGQLQQYGQARSRQPGDEGLAINAMANLFYAKAWSLNYFLHNYEEGGRPKYRDRFIEFMRFAYNPATIKDKNTGRESAKLVVPADFRRIFGLVEDAKFQAFDKEWRDWESKFVATSRKPEWDRRRQVLLRVWGLNPDGTKKKDDKK